MMIEQRQYGKINYFTMQQYSDLIIDEMDHMLKSDETTREMKRSGSFLFKRHEKVKVRNERRLSQDSRVTVSSVDAADLLRLEMEKSEYSPEPITPGTAVTAPGGPILKKVPKLSPMKNFETNDNESKEKRLNSSRRRDMGQKSEFIPESLTPGILKPTRR